MVTGVPKILTHVTMKCLELEEIVQIFYHHIEAWTIDVILIHKDRLSYVLNHSKEQYFTNNLVIGELQGSYHSWDNEADGLLPESPQSAPSSFVLERRIIDIPKSKVEMHFLQNGAPAHRFPKTKEWFESKLSDIWGKEIWLGNCPHLTLVLELWASFSRIWTNSGPGACRYQSATVETDT